MVRKKKPSFLFLRETLSKHKQLKTIRIKLGFAGLFVVDPVERCGGLALLWKKVEELEIQNYSRWHINAIVKLEEDTHPWKLIGFYGHQTHPSEVNLGLSLNTLRSSPRFLGFAYETSMR
jgi:hypothetical protein